MKDEYFDYLCDLGLGVDIRYYLKLCKILNEMDFEYILDMDENRAIDGIELRREFFKSKKVKWINDLYYHEKQCSVLEMMIALAKRCCDTIMDDGSGLDYTGELFRLMLQNLGLLEWPDQCFNREKVVDIISNFMDRKYSPNGKGSLFYIPDCPFDLRTIEIWNQAMWYIEQILN